jgi:hypothetical protein
MISETTLETKRQKVIKMISEMNNKELYIDAICGLRFNSYEMAGEMEEKGYANFSGNQWNAKWDWNRENLQKLSEKELEGLYNKLKEMQK